MTDDEINRQTAEVVMGFRFKSYKDIGPLDVFQPPGHVGWTDLRNLPFYTTDPAAWMSVVERMREKGFYCSMAHTVDMQWLVKYGDKNFAPVSHSREKSLGRAICLAALATMQEG